MKQWPKDGDPALFEDLTSEIVKAVQFAYTLVRKNEGQTIPLDGPDAPGDACQPSGSEMLRARTLAISEEDQGRDALTEIVGVAVRLGIEQGKRICMSPTYLGEGAKYKECYERLARSVEQGLPLDELRREVLRARPYLRRD